MQSCACMVWNIFSWVHVHMYIPPAPRVHYILLYTIMYQYCSRWPVHSAPITLSSVEIIVLFPWNCIWNPIRMMIPRNWVCKCISRTSERCKNQIHWDFNVSLIEGEAIGQDKWSELIKWDEMSQPLRHFSVDFISLSVLYRVIPTIQPRVTAAVQRWRGWHETIRNKQKTIKSIYSTHHAWTKRTYSPCSELEPGDNPSKKSAWSVLYNGVFRLLICMHNTYAC